MTRNRFMVGLVFLVFFVMSFLTNILGPIVPDIISSFRVSLTAAAVLPFSFFIAYGVMSIPAGFLVERFGDKPVMVAAFVASTLGSACFALFPAYEVAVASLFLMGAGMATLQVVINPLLRAAGGEEHFAFNSAFAQLVFGLASFISPWVYSYLVQNLGSGNGRDWFLRLLAGLTPRTLPWVSIYWIFAACSVVMIAITWLSRFPQVKRTEEEQAGTLDMYRKLLRNPMVWLFFGCVFAYVGSEQGTADWISK
ncbi:MAG TPA: MFS transporter, partial [Terriglobales bacterium]|nr:MFS transporter [Terriglobales bacterium]